MSDNNQIIRGLSSGLPGPTHHRIVVLTGARQTGKTTLCRRFYPQLRYMDMDAPENRDNQRRLPAVLWARKVGHALIDEAQRTPEVFEKVRYAFDQSGVTFSVLTGSTRMPFENMHASAILEQVAAFELWPLMQSELNPHATKDGRPLIHRICHDPSVGRQGIGYLLKAIQGDLPTTEDQAYCRAENYMLRWGGMPALLSLTADERRVWLSNYGYTHLERDIRDLARLDDLMRFRLFQKQAVMSSAMLVNYSEMARHSDISVDTARRYLDYLISTYQVVLLPPYHRPLTSTVVRTPKLYWTDIGLWRYMFGFQGEMSPQLYETMVVMEMIKWLRTFRNTSRLFFYRTRSGMQVDLLLEMRNGGIIALVLKAREHIRGKDIHALQTIARRAGENWKGGLVVYTGRQMTLLAKPDIWAVPSRRLFQ